MFYSHQHYVFTFLLFLQHTLIDQSLLPCYIINLDFKLHFFVKINILLVKQRIRARLFVNRALYKHCINKLLLSIYYSASTAQHLLLSIYYSASTTQHLLLSIYYSASTTQHLLLIIYCSASTAQHLLLSIYCSASTVQHLLFSIYCSASTTQHLLLSIYY